MLKFGVPFARAIILNSIHVCMLAVGWPVDAAFAKSSDRPAVLHLIDALPPSVRASVEAGVNNKDLSVYLNRALAKGGVFDPGGYTYLIRSRLLPAPGVRIMGFGRFIADKRFDDSAYSDSLNMMIRVASGLVIERGIVFDGNTITKPNLWLTGARNTQPVSDVVLDGTFENLSFDGIDISRNGGTERNTNIKVGATISNVGWTGANLEGIVGLYHDGLRVDRTGWHGIYVGYSDDVHGDHFSVSKANPPYRIYDGPGSFGGREKGFLFGHFSTHHARWTHFRLYDNRHAEYDGFGIGEDGPSNDSESSDIYAQGEVWYAGLFGFDVSSDMTADVSVFYPARQGIQFGLDLGGTLRNVHVKAMVRNNREDEAARFSATGTATRMVSTNAGSSVVRIESGQGFSVVAGQSADGTGLPTDARVLKVDGSLVTLDRPVPQTHLPSSPIKVDFRAAIVFEDCTLQLNAIDTPFGVGVESDTDHFSSYRGVTISGDLSRASEASVRRLNGDLPKGFAIKAKLKAASPIR